MSRVRLAGTALLTLIMVGVTGCVGAGPGVSATSQAGATATGSSPTALAAAQSSPSVSPTPPATWKSIDWASEGPLSWAAGSTQFQVFGWSHGYVGFSLHPTDPTSGYSDPTVVSYSSPDGIHWNQGQKLDTVAAGTQGWLVEIRSVLEGPAGLLAVGWSGACGAEYVDGLWTSPDGISWQPVDTQAAFGPNAVGIPRISGGSAGYVAVAYKSAAVWTSADGRAWQPVALDAPAFAQSKIDDGTAFSGGYVLAGTYGTPDCEAQVAGAGPVVTPPPAAAAVWWSADAASWTRVALPGASSSSDGQSVSVCRLSDRALLVIHDSWTSGTTPVVRRTAWTSTDGRTWKSVTLPGTISPMDIESDGLRALVAAPLGDSATATHLSLETFDGNYALVTLQQTGSQPAISYVDSPMSDGFGLIALGPSGVVVTDGHQLWMGTPSTR